MRNLASAIKKCVMRNLASDIEEGPMMRNLASDIKEWPMIWSLCCHISYEFSDRVRSQDEKIKV